MCSRRGDDPLPIAVSGGGASRDSTSPRRVGAGGGGREEMREHRRERTAQTDLRSVCHRRLRSRSVAPQGACPSVITPSPMALEEVPTGAPSPYAPPRGSWCTPAAAPVKRRSRRAVTVSARPSHHPATAVAASSRSASKPSNHPNMATFGLVRPTLRHVCDGSLAPNHERLSNHSLPQANHSAQQHHSVAQAAFKNIFSSSNQPACAALSAGTFDLSRRS